jgi:3-oxoadipate enol-lactonase
MTNTPDHTNRTATEFIEVNGVRLAYSQTGSGPLAIYAHGLVLSRASDRRLGLLDFSLIAADHHLITYDARGHGESGASGNPADYAWPSLADDLLALANHFSPDQPVSAIGTSMGTGTTLHAVVKAPGRFEKLVLTAPPTAWEARANQAEIYERLAAMVEASSSEAADAVFSQIPIPSIFADISSYSLVPDVRPAVLPIVLRGAGRSNLPNREQLARITQPTLILSWATDPTHPVSVAEELARIIPNARLHVSTTAVDVRTWSELASAFLSGKP